MATKRKSKPPKGYYTGGRVTEDKETVIPETAASSAAEEAAPIPAPVDDDAVRRAAEAARAAEEYQRQVAKLHQEIDNIQGLSVAQRELLHESPALVLPQNAWMVGKHHHAAKAEGIEPDSDAWKLRMRSGIANELKALRTPSAPSRSAPEIERAILDPSPEPAPERTLPSDTMVPPSGGMPSTALPHAGPSAALDRGRSRTMPVSAPVQRQTPSYSGGKTPDMARTITLTAAEREIARSSWQLPEKPDGTSWTPTEKEAFFKEMEMSYAAQKSRMMRLKANGEIQ